jgi:hypothetical protein
MSQGSHRPFPLRQARSVDWVWRLDIAERRRSAERMRMRFPPAKDQVQPHPVLVHRRLWSDASASILASPGTCHILHPSVKVPVFSFRCSRSSVQVPAEKFYVWLRRHASWNEFTNSLLHIQFPFMLINPAPLRHDRDRVQNGRAPPHGRGRSNFEW